MKFRSLCTGVFFICATILSGCAKHSVMRAAQYTNFSRSEGISQHPLCKFGVPQLGRGWLGGPAHLISRKGYILSHSAIDKIPLWVCEHIKASHIVGSAERSNRFLPDPELPLGQRSELADYKGSGYDRGHNAPAGDYKFSQERMDESFYLSNMCPQVGAGFNRSIWRVLEGRTRHVVNNRGEAFVITGNLFWDPEEDVEQTADGVVSYFVIGENEVAVPTHCFKIVIAPESPGSRSWQAISFVIENPKHQSQSDKKRDYTSFKKSIDWIEDHAGLNFMPELDDDPRLEEALERTVPSTWKEFLPLP